MELRWRGVRLWSLRRAGSGADVKKGGTGALRTFLQLLFSGARPRERVAPLGIEIVSQTREFRAPRPGGIRLRVQLLDENISVLQQRWR